MSNEMKGQVVAVTGANAGIGRATARALAAMGAKVLACGRDRGRLDEAIASIRAEVPGAEVTPLVADLSSVNDVRGLAGQIRAQTDRLDVLINNAGIGVDRRQETVDGFELTFAVNHLAPFVLTTELLDLLEASAPARVITVSSANHVGAKTLDLKDLQSRRRFAWQDVYARSKLCNVLFTRELSRRLAGTAVTVNCLHPGVIATEFGAGGDLRGLNAWMFRVLKWFLPGPERGARTSVYLASSPEVAETTGRYFADCKLKEPSRLATDDELAAALWRESERLADSVPRSPSSGDPAERLASR
jgi:retinol dehydrogenase-12